MTVTASAPQPRLVRYGQPAGRWVLLATVLGSALSFIDATVVNVALPRIGRDFHAGAAALQWTVNGYALTLAALILLGGSLGDRFGRRRIFVTGVTWFALASLLCGLAPDVQVLIAARVVQGIGGALLTPGSLAIIDSSFHPDDRGRAIGAWSGLGGIAGALGPFLGGWLVQAATWRLVFLINVPLAAIVVAVALKHIPETRNPDAGQGLDLPGVVLAAVALAGLTYGFTAWPAAGPGSASVIASLSVGVVALIGFVIAERQARHPMLPLDIFHSKAFTAANLATFVVYAALGGMIFLVGLNLQVVVRYSPLAAGTSILPTTIVMLLLSARAGALAQRIGPRIPMTIGPLICAVAMLLFARVGAHAAYLSDVLPGVVLMGLGLSLNVAPLTATALGSVDESRVGIASGVNNAVARAAGLLAVAVLPLAAGLGTGNLTDPAALGPVYRMAMYLCAGLLAAGSIIAAVAIPTKLVRPEPPRQMPEMQDLPSQT
ncbi:MAG TPA: DHA2 family efflux MFS transporter permease subunit [Actinocrinis sp.]|nr:DHA2 family efflux MFS transporter permease subunit [Actinocrinis sp.]HEV2346575.1 DHA2 family efflux MFS transporter permease subunit [Actinocrinis sp.]